ncbi:MAG: hypothetical protein V1889_03200 [archaeon]
MKSAILMTLPQWDDVTEYLHAFSQSIINTAKDAGVPINVLERESATRNNFEFELRDNHRLIVFNGHGSDDIIAGHKNEVIIKNGENENLLKEKITYARSCFSAKGIGVSSMKNSDAGCFIGYTLPFMFYNDITWSSNPLKDSIARIFFTTTNVIPNDIIRGKSCIEANENSKRDMLKAIKKALLRKDNMDSQSIVEALWNNYSFQVVVGNKNVKF